METHEKISETPCSVVLYPIDFFLGGARSKKKYVYGLECHNGQELPREIFHEDSEISDKNWLDGAGYLLELEESILNTFCIVVKFTF